MLNGRGRAHAVMARLAAAPLLLPPPAPPPCLRPLLDAPYAPLTSSWAMPRSICELLESLPEHFSGVAPSFQAVCRASRVASELNVRARDRQAAMNGTDGGAAAMQQ